ncbi:hypothetical protein ACS5PN_09245 [Roseateles sp. NT4]|uniref:hypothetical protein n=1 Tax=Roseateles sp. NT4 TaxID=3453715 RepID=UPI003EEE04C1
MSFRVRRAAGPIAAMALTLLTACGGGGGGGGGGGNPNPGPMPPPPSATGLVPTAGVPGAVLQEQAASLRPMRDGSHWTYRYQSFNGSGPDQVELVQKSVGDITFRESDPQDPDSGLDIYVDSQGTVRFSGTLRVTATASPVVISGIELRSPVRANEQIVMIDQRIEQTGLDVDRDGKIDPADVAVWRTVVGNETVNLPFRSEPVTAVRIDTTTVVRVVPSGGAAAQTVTQKLSSWYAPSLGLVREAAAGSGGGRALDSDQTLLGYDGGDKGYGYAATPITLNWAAPTVPYTSVLTLPGSGDLLLGEAGGLRRVDSHGRFKAFNAFGKGSLLGQTGNALWVMGGTPIGNDRTRYDLYRLDADGKPETVAYASFEPLDRVPAGSFNDTPRFAMAQGSAVFWVYWRGTRYDTPNSPGRDIVTLRRHNGNDWVGDPIEITLGTLARAGDPSALAQADGLLLTWIDGSTPRTLRVAANGTVGAKQAVEQGVDWVLGAWNLFGDGAGQWALWSGPAAAGADYRPHGVRLDTGGALLGTEASATALRNALLPSFQDLSSPLDMSHLGGRNGNWLYAETSFGVVYPDETRQRNHLLLRQIKAGAGAPASDQATIATYRVDNVSLMAPPIVFEKHTLVLTSNGSYMVPIVVWHR